MKVQVRVFQDREDKAWVVDIPQMPFATTYGTSAGEAIFLAKDIIYESIQDCLAGKCELYKPLPLDDFLALPRPEFARGKPQDVNWFYFDCEVPELDKVSDSLPELAR